MKILAIFLGLASLAFFPIQAWSSPVFSANGFICGKEEKTVTCKGPIPGGTDTITGTGHDIVYLTVNVMTAGAPTRYTYFSDTGCLIGYSFNVGGKPIAAVAQHRNGQKQTFEFGDGKYEKVIDYCAKEGPIDTKSLEGKSASAKTP